MFRGFLYFVVVVVSLSSADVDYETLLREEYFKKYTKEDFFYVKGKDSESHYISYENCQQFEKTESSPFIVLLLYKTSGAFLGMGAIINSRTVITVNEAIKRASGDPSKMLVLAGFKSAWWGANSQVRRIRQSYVNDFNLALLELETDMKFNNKIQPIKLEAIPDILTGTFQNNLLIFGIDMPPGFQPGDEIPKFSSYTASKHTMYVGEDCKKEYSFVKPGFIGAIHECVFDNKSYCSGCVGSPVLGSHEKQQDIKFVGIVLRTHCYIPNSKVLILKLARFIEWIRKNAYSGNTLIES